MEGAEQEWIVIGKITSTHGVRGEVKLALFVDEADFLSEVGSVFLEGRPARQEHRLQGVRFHHGNVLLHFEGVHDRDEAERFRNREVSVPLEWLPDLEEGEFYVAEIVGLSVESETGEALGQVAEVLFTGANEVYIVRGGPHGEILLPAIESVVQSVDLAAGRMVVVVPDGLLDL